MGKEDKQHQRDEKDKVAFTGKVVAGEAFEAEVSYEGTGPNIGKWTLVVVGGLGVLTITFFAIKLFLT